MVEKNKCSAGGSVSWKYNTYEVAVKAIAGGEIVKYELIEKLIKRRGFGKDLAQEIIQDLVDLGEIEFILPNELFLHKDTLIVPKGQKCKWTEETFKKIIEKAVPSISRLTT